MTNYKFYIDRAVVLNALWLAIPNQEYLPPAIIRVAHDEIVSKDSFFGSVNRADDFMFRSRGAT